MSSFFFKSFFFAVGDEIYSFLLSFCSHKIPKKLPNVFSASVSRSFATVFPASASKAAIGGGARRMATSP